jgi:hypothetical protein
MLHHPDRNIEDPTFGLIIRIDTARSILLMENTVLNLPSAFNAFLLVQSQPLIFPRLAEKFRNAKLEMRNSKFGARNLTCKF